MEKTTDLETVHSEFFQALRSFHERGETLLEKTASVDSLVKGLEDGFYENLGEWKKKIDQALARIDSRLENAVEQFDFLWRAELAKCVREANEELRLEFEKFKENRLAVWQGLLSEQNLEFEEKGREFRRFQETLFLELDRTIQAELEEILEKARSQVSQKTEKMSQKLFEEHAGSVSKLNRMVADGYSAARKFDETLNRLKRENEVRISNAANEFSRLSDMRNKAEKDVEESVSRALRVEKKLTSEFHAKKAQLLEKTSEELTELRSRLSQNYHEQVQHFKAEGLGRLSGMEKKFKREFEEFSTRLKTDLNAFHKSFETLTKDFSGSFEALKSHWDNRFEQNQNEHGKTIQGVLEKHLKIDAEKYDRFLEKGKSTLVNRWKAFSDENRSVIESYEETIEKLNDQNKQIRKNHESTIHYVKLLQAAHIQNKSTIRKTTLWLYAVGGVSVFSFGLAAYLAARHYWGV